jgi:hypothetical protein
MSTADNDSTAFAYLASGLPSGDFRLLFWHNASTGVVSSADFSQVFEVEYGSGNYVQLYSNSGDATPELRSWRNEAGADAQVFVSTTYVSNWIRYMLARTGTSWTLYYALVGDTSWTQILTWTNANAWSGLAIVGSVTALGSYTMPGASIRSVRLYTAAHSNANLITDSLSATPTLGSLWAAWFDGSTASLDGSDSSGNSRPITVSGTFLTDASDPIAGGASISSYSAFIDLQQSHSAAAWGATSATGRSEPVGASSLNSGATSAPGSISWEAASFAQTIGGVQQGAFAFEPGAHTPSATFDSGTGVLGEQALEQLTLGTDLFPHAEAYASFAISGLGASSLGSGLEVGGVSSAAAGATFSPGWVDERSEGSTVGSVIQSLSHSAPEEWAGSSYVSALGTSGIASLEFLSGGSVGAAGSAQESAQSAEFPSWSLLSFASEFVASESGVVDWVGDGSSAAFGATSGTAVFEGAGYSTGDAQFSSATGVVSERSEGSLAGSVNLSASHTMVEEWTGAGTTSAFAVVSGVGTLFEQSYSSAAQVSFFAPGVLSEVSEGSTVGSVIFSLSHSALEEWRGAGSLQAFASTHDAPSVVFEGHSLSALVSAGVSGIALEYPNPHTYVQDLPMFAPGWVEWTGAGSTTSLGTSQVAFVAEWIGVVTAPSFSNVRGPVQKVRIFSYNATVKIRSYSTVVKMSDCEPIWLQRVYADTFPSTLAFTDGCKPINLTGYTQFILRLVSPNYPPVSLTGSIVDARLGKVAFGPTLQQATDLAAGVYGFEVTALSPEGLGRTLLLGDLEILNRPR